jgi:hypothetical protein
VCLVLVAFFSRAKPAFPERFLATLEPLIVKRRHRPPPCSPFHTRSDSTTNVSSDKYIPYSPSSIFHYNTHYTSNVDPLDSPDHRDRLLNTANHVLLHSSPQTRSSANHSQWQPHTLHPLVIPPLLMHTDIIPMLHLHRQASRRDPSGIRPKRTNEPLKTTSLPRRLVHDEMTPRLLPLVCL